MGAETSGNHRMACLEIRGGNRRESYSVELPGLSAWISCRPLPPASEGGDLHYLTVCSTGAIARIVLADVAGRGEIVSSVAGRLRNGLRKHVNTWDQSILIQELNNAFLAGAKGVQFATAFVLGHYAESGEMVFTNAGHVPPLWYRAAERKWVTISHSTPYATEVADLPLGIIAGTPNTQTAIQMSPGDLLVLYTDGLTESRDDAGRLLGSDRLATLASTVRVGAPDKAGEALFARVETFRSPTPAFDDETMIVLRRNGSWWWRSAGGMSSNSPPTSERNSFSAGGVPPAGVFRNSPDRQSSNGAYQNTSQVPDEDMVLIQVWAE